MFFILTVSPYSQSQIEKLNDLERLYLYMQLPDGSDTGTNGTERDAALDKKYALLL